MGLLTAGYWPATYWPEDYWSDDYWQGYIASHKAFGTLSDRKPITTISGD